MARLRQETGPVEMLSPLLQLVDHFCLTLVEHRELSTIRVGLGSRSWLGDGPAIVALATRYGLGCWFTKNDLILQVPRERFDLRIDSRSGIAVVTLSRLVQKGDA
jgi:hypothetical protein